MNIDALRDEIYHSSSYEIITEYIEKAILSPKWIVQTLQEQQNEQGSF